MKKRYGSWTVLKTYENSAFVLAQCKCGKEVEKRLSVLEKGHSKRCWDCYMKFRRTRVAKIVPKRKTVDPEYRGDWIQNNKSVMFCAVVGASFITFLLLYYSCYLYLPFLD